MKNQRRTERLPSMSSWANAWIWCLAVVWYVWAPSFAAAQSGPDLIQRVREARFESPARAAALQNQQQTGAAGAQGESAIESLTSQIAGGPEAWLSPKGLSNSLQILLLLTVLSLAPAILLMTTCYVRVIVVFGLLKQALGSQQLPPSQVITSISLFVTLFVMSPVWKQVYDDAVEPYTRTGSTMSSTDAWEQGVAPIRNFMARQIAYADNHDDVHLFYSRYAPNQPDPTSFDDIPLQVLLPAYMLSELKVAFLMGFKIYLPFLILDVVIASVTVSMGMMMLPPAMISTPFKLLLFVLVDGWTLVVKILLQSFGTFGT
jgi:flagellar biosynthesis protein FliP